MSSRYEEYQNLQNRTAGKRPDSNSSRNNSVNKTTTMSAWQVDAMTAPPYESHPNNAKVSYSDNAVRHPVSRQQPETNCPRTDSSVDFKQELHEETQSNENVSIAARLRKLSTMKIETPSIGADDLSFAAIKRTLKEKVDEMKSQEQEQTSFLDIEETVRRRSFGSYAKTVAFGTLLRKYSNNEDSSVLQSTEESKSDPSSPQPKTLPDSDNGYRFGWGSHLFIDKVESSLRSRENPPSSDEEKKCPTDDPMKASRKISISALAKTVSDTAGARIQNLPLINKLSTPLEVDDSSDDSEITKKESVGTTEEKSEPRPVLRSISADETSTEREDKKVRIKSPPTYSTSNKYIHQTQTNNINRKGRKKSLSAIANSVSLGVRLRRYSLNERGRPLASDSSVTTMGRTPHVSNGQPNNAPEHTQNEKRTVLQTIQSESIDSNQEEENSWSEEEMSESTNESVSSDEGVERQKKKEKKEPDQQIPEKATNDRRKSFSVYAKAVSLSARKFSLNPEKVSHQSKEFGKENAVLGFVKAAGPRNQDILSPKVSQKCNENGKYSTENKTSKNLKVPPESTEADKNDEKSPENLQNSFPKSSTSLLVMHSPPSDSKYMPSGKLKKDTIEIKRRSRIDSNDETFTGVESRKLSFHTAAKTVAYASRKSSMNESAMKSRSTPVSPRHSRTGNVQSPDLFDAEMKKLFSKTKHTRRNAISEICEENQKKIAKELKRFLKEQKEAEKAEQEEHEDGS